MPSYCAPCITELALVREAVTKVAGTASCMAHAVLLTYPTDVPGRRRQRLLQLRDLAEAKLKTALQEEQARLELLIAEYVLAENMDLTGPGGQHPERARRERDRPRRGPRPERPRTSDVVVTTVANTERSEEAAEPTPEPTPEPAPEPTPEPAPEPTAEQE